MKYSIKYIRPILTTMAFAFLLLIGLQYLWLSKARSTNQDLFIQKMDAAASKAANLYREAHHLPEDVHDIIKKKSISAEEERFIHGELENILDRAFIEYNIPRTYSYGLYRHREPTGNFLVFGNSGIEGLEVGCDSEEFRKYGWASLTCGKGYGKNNSYHLAVFPSYNAFVMNDIKYPLGLSLASLILLCLGFFYLAKIIETQKRISEIKNDFINNLTHEFKTPIFSISLASKSLRKSLDARATTPEKSYLDAIDHENQRLTHQVDRILQLSLLESKKLQWSAKEVDIHQQIKEVIDGFSLILAEKQGRIEVDFKASDFTLEADDLHLKNVWANLVDNAIKYSDKKVDIKISTNNTAEGEIVVAVSDSGIGFTKEQKQHLFEKFYRVPTGNLHSAKGFGVGLAYVRGIIERIKGRIMVTSAINEGSTFEVILPLDG